MPAAGEIPTSIAIVIHRDEVPLARVTDFDADPTVRALSRDETVVGDRRAVVAELEHTGDGMYSSGHRQYAYYIDAEPNTIIAMTHSASTAPPYGDRQRILDDMMASLRWESPR